MSTTTLERLDANIDTYTFTPEVITDDHGEPWFVLKDLCDILGIANASDVASRMPTEDKGVGKIDTPGGSQTHGTETRRPTTTLGSLRGLDVLVKTLKQPTEMKGNL